MAEEIMQMSLRKCVSFLNSPKNKLKKNIFSFHTHTHTQQSVSRVAKKYWLNFFYIFSILVTLAFYTYINVIKTLKYIFGKNLNSV
jgi:hypothetical protein